METAGLPVVAIWATVDCEVGTVVVMTTPPCKTDCTSVVMACERV